MVYTMDNKVIRMTFKSKVDKMGRTVIPSEIRKFLGITMGDIIEWIISGNYVIVRRSRKGIKSIRNRLNKLRKKAPECFVIDTELEETELSGGLKKWALAKLGLME